MYNVFLTVTDNGGAEGYKSVEVRTTPGTFIFSPEPYIADANTKALFHFDSSFGENSGKGYSFTSNGSVLSGDNLLWMRTPVGKTASFMTINDTARVMIPRKDVITTADGSFSIDAKIYVGPQFKFNEAISFSIDAKIYVDTLLGYDVADAPMFTLTQGDARGVGMYEAKYVDGQHIKVMDGYTSQQKIVSDAAIKNLQAQGKMKQGTWYELKFVVSPTKTEVYVNDTKVGESSIVPHFASSDEPLVITMGGFTILELKR